jgi:hypothetical protein
MDINTFLNTHEFEPHEMGNYELYGLNMFGCNSIIKYNDKIWRFYNFENSTAIYETYNRERIILSSKNYTDGVQRMQIKMKLN